MLQSQQFLQMQPVSVNPAVTWHKWHLCTMMWCNVSLLLFIYIFVYVLYLYSPWNKLSLIFKTFQPASQFFETAAVKSGILGCKTKNHQSKSNYFLFPCYVCQLSWRNTSNFQSNPAGMCPCTFFDWPTQCLATAAVLFSPRVKQFASRCFREAAQVPEGETTALSRAFQREMTAGRFEDEKWMKG